jgi:Rrf2 family protein
VRAGIEPIRPGRRLGTREPGECHDAAVRVTAKVDYAVRALVELAAAGPTTTVKGDAIAEGQGLPLKFLENILAELRRHGIVSSQRGADGGYRFARPPEAVTVADVIRAVEGPLADVHGTPPEDLDPPGAAAPVRDVWLATRVALRSVLERVTIADIAAGSLPDDVARMLDAPDAGKRR